MKKKSQQIDWLQNEIIKDKKDLDKDKELFINQIKNLKKEDICPSKKQEKLSIWQRIKKVIMG
jgi:hypothetical protein